MYKFVILYMRRGTRKLWIVVFVSIRQGKNFLFKEENTFILRKIDYNVYVTVTVQWKN